MIDIPLGLRHAIESGQGVLFLGAGIGCHLIDPHGKPAPNATGLAKELAEHFSIDVGSVCDLAAISKVVEIRKGRAELVAYLQKRFANLQPDESLQWLFTLRWKAIFTTNYDRGIQRAYELNPEPPQKYVTITNTTELVPFDQRFEVPIYHLHGSLFDSANPHIVITEDDYSHFRERRRMMFELLKLEFATSCIIYIGYANRDPNWKIVLDEISSEFYPAAMPHSYRIAPDTDTIEIEILKSRGIETVEAEYGEFAKSASITICELKVDSDFLQKIRSGIPPNLMPAFEKSPPAIARLLSSWTYVNQAPFDEKPNIHNFLRGDRANWALIGSSQHFKRDLEETVYDDLLDYATSDTRAPSVVLILGPAGYGVTTIMMTLAVKLIQERAGAVFMLKPGSVLIEGDVDFASTIFPDKSFFFVDNAVDHISALESIIQRLKDSKRTAMFILGERLNEWRQGHGRLRGKEYEIEPLSDPEINRLLDCLGEHTELNKLEYLSRDVQFSAIKVNYSKELLVAMREATEGKSFDAILEDEFRGIQDSMSRQLYLTVCCFYQHGAYLRDNLLAELMNISLNELFQKTGDATEGVVIYDCTDESKGTYAARTRHRTIAKIVWERCGNSIEKEKILQSALANLNLNYKPDKIAFEAFVRSDRLVDSIRSLDAKIRFFDKACQKDPESPYVRQHYSRMLSRESKTELSLSQIEEALKLNPKVRVLHHTKGVILMQMALENESIDLARRRLAQSEASFRQVLSMNNRDEYSYQGLAQLYLGWAKRNITPEETADYIANAEGVINDGLKMVRVRDALWIESSNIQTFIGDHPSHLRALEKAVYENPGGIVARYLLGRSYRKQNCPDKALDILEPVIKNHPDEFRSFVEYALCLVSLKKPYKNAIAILELSTLYGYSDPRFIATLGGMLFMDNNFSKAERVFAESLKREFTSSEMNTIQFRPPDPIDPNNSFRVTGKVISVKTGHAILESPGYPNFLCPGSKYKGVIMQPGLMVTFEVAFSAKGPVADRPMICNV